MSKLTSVKINSVERHRCGENKREKHISSINPQSYTTYPRIIWEKKLFREQHHVGFYVVTVTELLFRVSSFSVLSIVKILIISFRCELRRQTELEIEGGKTFIFGDLLSPLVCCAGWVHFFKSKTDSKLGRL